MEESIYKNAKIVVIDDVEEVLSSTKNSLKFEGMDVETFSNPFEALEYLKENRVDVILLDFFMPQLNGDKFIQKLREFNNETAIILRTGYSDKVPPMEMIDSLNIQGYIDKLKGNEELILMTKSAIKTAHLYKKTIEQQKEIDAKSYQNEFFGKFLYRLMGEIQERSFAVSGNVLALEQLAGNIPAEVSEVYTRSLTNIKNGISKLKELVKSLIVEDSMMTLSEMLKTLNKLFEIALSVKGIELIIDNKIDNQYQLIQCNPKYLLYILVDIIEYCIEKGINPINIQVEKKDNIEISISKINYGIELIEKISNLSKLDQNITIKSETEKIIVITK